MPNLSALSRGTQVLAAAGLLLLIVTFLPWQDFGEAIGGDIAESLGVDVDATWNAWHGFWGIVMGLMVIALLAWVVARVMDVRLPIEVPDGLVTVALGALIFLFALIKNLADDYSTIWSYIGVLLAAAVAYGSWLRYQEAGGTIETLKASLPARQTESSSAGGPAGTTLEDERYVTPTSPAEPTTPQPAEAAQPTQPTQPATPAEPAQPAQPARPAAPTSTTSPPPSPQTTEPVTQAGPTPPGPPTPPSERADETEAERRPPQPPPSSTDQT